MRELRLSGGGALLNLKLALRAQGIRPLVTLLPGGHRVGIDGSEPDPFLVVLCSFHEGPLAELQAGQALQHILLTVTSLGLSVSFQSQPRCRTSGPSCAAS
ncbi:MAG TPA: hypothetical protein VFO16_13795 [Pseudonocardiaceae bacterium]|nr:hypothetical protein [Pseudonocardiaceae bacterium]